MTNKSSRKSIVANFGLLSAELENRLATDAPASPQQPAPTARVGLKRDRCGAQGDRRHQIGT